MTISALYGLINQSEFYNKRIASSDLSGYYLMHKGEFAYQNSVHKKCNIPYKNVAFLFTHIISVLSENTLE